MSTITKKIFDEDAIITQAFGVNPDYYAKWNFAGHEGIDLVPKSKRLHSPVFAVESGVVVRDTDDPLGDLPNKNYGKKVVIWNQNTRRSWWYCHLESNDVSLGQKIEEGQKIGNYGNTGNTTGPHLHLCSRLSDANGTAINTDNGFKGFIDPMPYLVGQVTSGGDLEAAQNKIGELTRALEDTNKLWNADKIQKEKLDTALKELQVKFDGQKTSLDSWETFLDHIWGLLSPLGKDKNTQNALGELTELISKEDQLLEEIKNSNGWHTKYDNLFSGVSKTINYSGGQEEGLYTALQSLVATPKPQNPAPTLPPVPEIETPVAPRLNIFLKIVFRLQEFLRNIFRTIRRG